MDGDDDSESGVSMNGIERLRTNGPAKEELEKNISLTMEVRCIQDWDDLEQRRNQGTKPSENTRYDEADREFLMTNGK